jgi:hypothetical protein
MTSASAAPPGYNMIAEPGFLSMLTQALRSQLQQQTTNNIKADIYIEQ